MKKVSKNRFFATPKRTVLTILCTVAILCMLGAIAAFAVSTVAESSAIGAENAQNFAFVDAGVDPATATAVHTEFEFRHGQFVYEVDFTANNVRYEYCVRASDGAIVKKEQEMIRTGASDVTVQPGQTAVSLEEAKALALADAGVAEADAVFTKAKPDVEDGESVYEIEFHSAGTEYEYEISAVTGAIRSKSTEPYEDRQNPSRPTTAPAVGTPEPGAATQAPGTALSVEDAKALALADAGVAAADATFTKAKPDWENGVQVYEIEFYCGNIEYEYEIDAVTGAVRSRSTETYRPADPTVQPAEGEGAVSLDRAKEIAVSHAGFTVAEVRFTKAKLDREDGITVYEIEFFADGWEYEYTIRASNGTILDWERDRD